MAKANLSPALHTELSEQLEKQLDETDELDSLRTAVAGAFRDELKRSRLAVARTRRQLKGQELPQKEIPGTERAQAKRDPFIVRLMAAARELLEYREEEAQDEAASPRKGLTSVTLRAGGREVTATPEQLKNALDEVQRRKGKGGDAPPLTWHVEGDGRVLGVAANGLVYAVEALGNGPAPFRWTQGRTRSPSSFGTITAAKEDADRAELKRLADQRLRNAGDGELTKADTAGPAVARKKGGRRG